MSGPDGPLISDHLARLRPFLTDGDFAPGSWGQSPIDAVGVIDITVEKVAYSAFHASRLEFVLGRLGITALLVAGIVTNGGVASTVRAAHVLDLHTVVLSDGCAAFGTEPHDTAIASLATGERHSDVFGRYGLASRPQLEGALVGVGADALYAVAENAHGVGNPPALATRPGVECCSSYSSQAVDWMRRSRSRPVSKPISCNR